MARGTCVDCDATVELTEHGTCVTCGSSSIVKIQYNKVHMIVPTLDVNEMLGAVEALMVKIGDKDAGATEQSALQFISARLSRMQGLTLGQHLENTITIWNICKTVEEAEVSDVKAN